MAIDPRIPLGVQQVQIPDPMQVRAQMQQARMGDLQIQNAEAQQAEAQRTAEIRAAAKRAIAQLRDGKPDEVFSQLQDPEARSLAEEWYHSFSDNKRKREALLNQDRQDRARLVQRFGYDPIVAEVMFGLDDDPQAAEIFERLGGDANALKQVIDGFANTPPKPPGGFTLGPGQIRYDDQGNQVAVAPPTPTKVTFGPPHPQIVNGKRVLVRAGSDGQIYDMDRKPIAAEAIAPEPQAVPAPPSVGSFEDFVTRKYGRNPTADQIEEARRIYQSASRPGVELTTDMSSDYQTALERAIGSIPAARRGTWVQTANRLWQEGNIPELRGVIMQAAIEAEDVTTKNQVRNRQATIAALQDVEVMLADLKKAGVPTGWLSGSAENLARRLGKSTNPAYVAIGNRMADTLINYRRAATGAAFSVQESASYERMFPNYKQEFPVNEAAIQGLTRAIRTNDRVFWESKLGPDGARLVGALPSVDGQGHAPATHVFDPASGTVKPK